MTGRVRSGLSHGRGYLMGEVISRGGLSHGAAWLAVPGPGRTGSRTYAACRES